MAPFRTENGTVPAIAADQDGGMVAFREDKRGAVWERRRRRLDKKNRLESEDKELGEMKKSSPSSSRRRSQSRQDHDDEDLDPYDSDPGESYRQHCMKMNGIGSKSCLVMPNFLKKRSLPGGEGETVLTAPPSPMASEMGDLFGQIPASLPPNVQRVRYSLRSSVTDGSEKQPMGPSVMERRELRPNNVHLNVSHWSDTGGRPYMEDR